MKIMKNFGYALKISFRISPSFFMMKVFLLIVDSLFPFISAFLWRNVLNNLVYISTLSVATVWNVSAFLALGIISHYKKMLDTYVEMSYSDAIELYRDSVMMDTMSRIDMYYYDSALLQDKMEYAKQGFGALTEIVWTSFKIISGVVGFVIAIILICGYNYIIGIITVILVIPDYLYKRYSTKRHQKINMELQRSERIKDNYENVLNSPKSMFELKLNSFGGYLFSKFMAQFERIAHVRDKERRRDTIMVFLMSVLTVSSDLAVMIDSTYSVSIGKIGIGDFQYNLSIVRSLRSSFASLMQEVNSFISCCTHIENLRDFNSINPIHERSGATIPSKTFDIEFQNVSFCYPGTAKKVLNNCSFHICKDTSNAIVGGNGSGKSTILKLLFRLYEPDSGRILIDGVNIEEYDVYKLRSRFGVVFQDCIKYDLQLREVIGLSNYRERGNDLLLDYSCKESGFSQVIKEWEDGYDSYLGRTLSKNGKNLSGGQWQLLGISRAYFRNASILVFDEPSAWLDPVAEDNLFNRISLLTKGKTSIMISHRLGGIVNVDEIIVLKEGTVVENGDFNTLMEKRGEFYRSFMLQKSRYE